jgi:hypothetical protein
MSPGNVQEYSPGYNPATTGTWRSRHGHQDGIADSFPGEYYVFASEQQAIAWWDLAVTGYPDWRNWFPPELDDLVEGVDYTVRPDRTVDDPDAYIEYEPDGVAEFLGWNGVGYVACNNPLAADGTSVDLVLNVGFAKPAPGGNTWMTTGTHLTTLSTPGNTQSPTASLAAPVGLNTSVALAATLAAGGDTYATDPTWDYVSQFFHPDANVTALVRLPRWRYWKPSQPHVRMKQRGDGLGTSVRRMRGGGTTRQAGRLRGSW